MMQIIRKYKDKEYVLRARDNSGRACDGCAFEFVNCPLTNSTMKKALGMCAASKVFKPATEENVAAAVAEYLEGK